jgi:hypothetical protein
MELAQNDIQTSYALTQAQKNKSLNRMDLDR